MHYGAYSLDVTVVMLVDLTNPVGVELCSYVNTFFCFNKNAGHIGENAQQIDRPRDIQNRNILSLSIQIRIKDSMRHMV